MDDGTRAEVHPRLATQTAALRRHGASAGIGCSFETPAESRISHGGSQHRSASCWISPLRWNTRVDGDPQVKPKHFANGLIRPGVRGQLGSPLLCEPNEVFGNLPF